MNWNTVSDAGQAVFGVITTVVAVVGLAYTLSADQRMVGVLEKLSSTIASMPHGAARNVLMTERDARAFRWALGPQAPKHPGLLVSGLVALVLALLLLAVWVVLVLALPGQGWTWAVYFVGLLLSVAGLLLGRVRRLRREKWLQERREHLEAQ
jgi:hypothetical protein